MGVTLTAPGGTCFGRAAWRLPLQILDDEAFCDDMAAMILQYLEAHPVTAQLSRGQRWVHLKRSIRLFASSRVLAAAKMRRQALTALKADSRAAQAQYETHPTDSGALLQWRQAHHTLQQLNAGASQAAALQAGVVWQHYGEQSTFWFYHLARERREQTVIAQLGTPGQPGHITLDTYASTQQAGQALEGYFSASSPEGLFAPPDTSPQAQQELLMALNLHLTPQQSQQGEGTAGDGSISLEELTQTLQGLPRGKSPGFDGLPYEFYQRFWDQLGPELTAVLSEAFQAGAASLPADMTEGRVTLLHKGKGADRAQPASYRPITLLNTDYKLAARVIASRLGPLLNPVVDSTQTGFLPQRWIGDNILAHLETIDLPPAQPAARSPPLPGLREGLRQAGQTLDGAVHGSSGVRSRSAAMGQPPACGHHGRGSLQRLAHSTLPSPVGGLPGQPFVAPAVRSGGPAHGKRTHASWPRSRGCMPSARPWVSQRPSCTATQTTPPSMQPHRPTQQPYWRAASASIVRRLEPGCRQPRPPAWAIGCLQHLTGPDADTGITLSAAGSAITHLGIPLSTDPDAAARTLYTAILQRLDRRIARWSGFRLSLLGGAHVAKQALVSIFTYHGTFVPVPADILRQLCTSVYTFVAAKRPAAAGAAHLFPSRAISARILQQGGIGLVDIPAQLTALQAKIISRLAEPERVPWKAYFSGWLAMPLTAEQRTAVPAQSQHLWQLGTGLPFSSFPSQSIQAPRRVAAYLEAFRQLHPHRLVSPEDMPFQEVMGQPLFHSSRITHLGQPIAWEHWARLGRTTVEHLRDLLRSRAAQPAQQQEMALLLDAMPAAWAAHIHGPSPQPTHLASADPADRRIFCPGPDGHLTHTYTASSTAALLAVEQLPQPMLGRDLPADLRPVLVIQWDPTRAWHPRHSAGQHQVPALGPHLVGAWPDGTVDPRSWGFSSVPAHEYVVRDSASRLRALRRILAGQQDAISPIRPTIWASAYGDEHSGIRRLEARWAARQAAQDQHAQPEQPGPSRVRGAPDPSSDAAWMHPSRSRPPPLRDRAPLQPALLAAPDAGAAGAQAAAPTQRQRLAAALRTDTTDIITLAQTQPGSEDWAHTWTAVHSSALDREGRITAWRLLHGRLFVGAFLRHVGRGTSESHACPHHGCVGQLASLSHVMLTCPASQAVWQWFASIWTAISQQEPPPLHADLLLADDRRGPWQPAPQLGSLWQRLRLLVITQLWTAYCTARSRPDRQVTPAHIAARVLAAARERMRRDWLLVGSGIRLRAGVLSHWLRGRQPAMTQEQFQQHWCHGDALCSLPEDMQEPPIIHWTAMHPVSLPQ